MPLSPKQKRRIARTTAGGRTSRPAPRAERRDDDGAVRLPLILDAAPDEVEPREAESRPAAARIARAEAEVRAAREETQQALSELAELRRGLDVDAATDKATVNTLVPEDSECEQGSDLKQESEFTVAASSFRSFAEKRLELSVATSSFRSFDEEALSSTSNPSIRCSASNSWNTSCSSWNPLDNMCASPRGQSRVWSQFEQDYLSILDRGVFLSYHYTKKAQDVTRGALGVLREVRRMDTDAALENILDKILGEEGREQGPKVEQDSSFDLSVTSFIPENPSACKLIQSMFMDEKTADVMFKVGEKEEESNARKPATFYAHRFILQKYGTTMAELCGSEGGLTTIPITDVDPAIFRLLLGHMYGEKLAVAVLKSKARELIDAANKYGVGHLKLEAEACFVESTPISVENMMEHLLYADAKNCALLKEAVLDFFAENKAEVLTKVSLQDIPGGLLGDMLAVVAREEGASGDDEGTVHDRFETMRVNELRKKIHEKGLDVDGSRDTLIAALEKSS